MIQGTGSDVGKSLLVAGLGRVLTRRGLKVRPFKPQNMSNNAAVTVDGGEIGRAQALQARACGLPPLVDMNPVLLKPQTETGAQVVVQGRVVGRCAARAYQRYRRQLLPPVLESFHRLAAEADLVLVEGAGSPAEVNLRAGDIANMGFAEAADLPVVLVGDIDRGGVIAAVVGTWTLLPPTERARLKGYVINRFRGDISLFDDGLTAITAYTGLPSLGVVPYLPAATRLPAEDALALDDAARCRTASPAQVHIAVPMLSRIANFDDLDPLRLEPGVALTLIRAGRPLPGDADLVILPGSKATIGDLVDLRAQGWDIDLTAHVRRGGHVLGLCGGLQMLGQRIADPDGREGPAGVVDGLGLLDLETTLSADKTLTEVTGRHVATGATVCGYEMHLGRSTGPALGRPFLNLDDGSGTPRPEGAVSADGRIAATYVHGLFAADGFRRSFLAGLVNRTWMTAGSSYDNVVEAALDALADHLVRHVDVDHLLRIAHADR